MRIENKREIKYLCVNIGERICGQMGKARRDLNRFNSESSELPGYFQSSITKQRLSEQQKESLEQLRQNLPYQQQVQQRVQLHRESFLQQVDQKQSYKVNDFYGSEGYQKRMGVSYESPQYLRTKFSAIQKETFQQPHFDNNLDLKQSFRELQLQKRQYGNIFQKQEYDIGEQDQPGQNRHIQVKNLESKLVRDVIQDQFKVVDRPIIVVDNKSQYLDNFAKLYESNPKFFYKQSGPFSNYLHNVQSQIDKNERNHKIIQLQKNMGEEDLNKEIISSINQQRVKNSELSSRRLTSKYSSNRQNSKHDDSQSQLSSRTKVYKYIKLPSISSSVSNSSLLPKSQLHSRSIQGISRNQSSRQFLDSHSQNRDQVEQSEKFDDLQNQQSQRRESTRDSVSKKQVEHRQGEDTQAPKNKNKSSINEQLEVSSESQKSQTQAISQRHNRSSEDYGGGLSHQNSLQIDRKNKSHIYSSKYSTSSLDPSTTARTNLVRQKLVKSLIEEEIKEEDNPRATDQSYRSDDPLDQIEQFEKKLQKHKKFQKQCNSSFFNKEKKLLKAELDQLSNQKPTPKIFQGYKGLIPISEHNHVTETSQRHSTKYIKN